jgi:hypothetical protein
MDDELEIPFTPVPRQRRRRNGWSEARQRGFIAALAECGSVTRAARAVGMSPRSAYRLLDADGADDFARAWDAALDTGIERVRASALERSLHGSPVAIIRRGRLLGVETRFNDRLAIALLGGRDSSIAAYRRTAVSRREHRQDLKLYDETGIMTLRAMPGHDGPVRVPTRPPAHEPTPEQLAEEALIRERLKEQREPRPRQPRVRFH